ncbi:MOSC domain-containing protein [Lacibacterium aquatile]|uniref:MOSC domain-containing protein n=1 Tax=Lacibacterium aquatile TaxID=1168082 RepID=A0ABW5DNA8_9PROT
MRVVDLYRYPVKSLRGYRVEEASIEKVGMAGDRRWLVIDTNGRFLSIRELPKMTTIEAIPHPAGLTLRHADAGELLVEFPKADAPRIPVTVWKDSFPAPLAADAASEFLTALLGQPVRLAYFDDPSARPVDQTFGGPNDHVSFADGYPILITTVGSLAALNGELAAPLPMTRFRPNIVIDGVEPWGEDTWREVRIGDLRARIVKPCARCTIVTHDPVTGERPARLEPLTTLKRIHATDDGRIIFGQNVIPDNEATVRVGDPVEILASGKSNLF